MQTTTVSMPLSAAAPSSTDSSFGAVVVVDAGRRRADELPRLQLASAPATPAIAPSRRNSRRSTAPTLQAAHDRPERGERFVETRGQLTAAVEDEPLDLEVHECGLVVAAVAKIRAHPY